MINKKPKPITRECLIEAGIFHAGICSVFPPGVRLSGEFDAREFPLAPDDMTTFVKFVVSCNGTREFETYSLDEAIAKYNSLLT